MEAVVRALDEYARARDDEVAALRQQVRRLQAALQAAEEREAVRDKAFSQMQTQHVNEGPSEGLREELKGVPAAMQEVEESMHEMGNECDQCHEVGESAGFNSV